MPDLYTPLPGETLMEYLVRSRPQYEWEDGDGTTEPFAVVEPGEFDQRPRYTVRSHVTSAEFAAAVKTIWPTPPLVGLPPSWPGAENVTLGTPLAMVDGLEIPGPLAGVVLEITGHPPSAGKYGFGGFLSWRYLGAVLFIADNGAAEWPCQIGPEEQIVTPRTMQIAASAVLRLNGGFSGTITPWTIST
jgi:hypothetical protein